MELKATRYEIDGRVATVWLHRPHRHNAWTGRMHAEYRWIMAELDADTEVRAIIVTGTAPAFCVGGDTEALAGHAAHGGYDQGLGDSPAMPGHGARPEFDHDFSFQYALRVPVIAAVNGACAGIGLALAMFCDLRFASAAARMTTAAPKLGLPAEFGLSWTLPRLVGVTRAADLLLSGRVFTAAETATWGLWNGVAADGEATLATAIDYARSLVGSTGPKAVSITKRQLYDDLLRHDVGASIEESKQRIDDAVQTAEYREGVAALRDKRPPRF
ncbi:MAG TPA: enoyl-CoA hydratase-related protein [Ilumatobacteraceae bacterium]|jgi:enoyl-CoA hydratase/carnithine racemase